MPRSSLSPAAALRSRTAGSQDESPCRAIHKQRPYPASANTQDETLFEAAVKVESRGQNLRVES